MKEKLLQLLETMKKIDTKGESTLFMADCLLFVDRLIQECAAEEQEENADGK